MPTALAVKVTLYTNEGASSFVSLAGTPIDATAMYTTTVLFADIDNDGDSDLFIGNHGAANELYKNDGLGGTQA